MTTLSHAADEFLAKRKIAVACVSRDSTQLGNLICAATCCHELASR